MGFLGFWLLPVLATAIAVVIGVIAFLGACLLVIGITGIVMDKLHVKLAPVRRSPLNRTANIVSLVFGVGLILFPVGYLVFIFVSALM